MPNEINRLCERIDNTIDSVVQNWLNQFKRDCQRLEEAVDRRLAESRCVQRQAGRQERGIAGSLPRLVPAWPCWAFPLTSSFLGPSCFCTRLSFAWTLTSFLAPLPASVARERRCARVMNGIGLLIIGLILVAVGIAALVAHFAPEVGGDGADLGGF